MPTFQVTELTALFKNTQGNKWFSCFPEAIFEKLVLKATIGYRLNIRVAGETKVYETSCNMMKEKVFSKSARSLNLSHFKGPQFQFFDEIYHIWKKIDF